MESDNTFPLFECMCYDLLERFLVNKKTYKISDMRKLVDEAMLKTVYTNTGNINRHLIKYNFSGIAVSHKHKLSTDRKSIPHIHTDVFCGRLYEYFNGELTPNSRQNTVLDIKAINVSSPLYPLFIGIVHSFSKEKQNWNKMRIAALDAASLFLDYINDSDTNPKEYKEYDENVLESIYSTLLDCLFPDSLFEVLESLQQQIQLTYSSSDFYMDRYNFLLLKQALKYPIAVTISPLSWHLSNFSSAYSKLYIAAPSAVRTSEILSPYVIASIYASSCFFFCFAIASLAELLIKPKIPIIYILSFLCIDL